MRVPDALRGCVAFLGRVVAEGDVIKHEDPPYRGTGFFVAVGSPNPDHVFPYLVTARHSADALADRPFVIRLNTCDGTARNIVCDAGTRWFRHPDPTVDVAVLPIAPDRSTYDYRWVVPRMLVGPKMIEKLNIGVGDEVFITGLFAYLFGNDRNIPIVRTGNVAMMPAERVPTRLGQMEAYLIEARSIGGISGAPVFVRETVPLMHEYPGTGDERDTVNQVPIYAAGPFYLLGVMHGHWDIPPEMMNRLGSGANAGVNMGIAIVTPATKIREVLSLPELVSRRESLAATSAKGSSSTSA